MYPRPSAIAYSASWREVFSDEFCGSRCGRFFHRPVSKRALVMLLLSLADQFGQGVASARAQEILPKLKNDYERAYYEAIIHERQAYALLRQGSPSAQDAFRKAMACYEQAEHLRPTRNDDAILRWNTCARALMRMPNP